MLYRYVQQFKFVSQLTKYYNAHNYVICFKYIQSKCIYVIIINFFMANTTCSLKIDTLKLFFICKYSQKTNKNRYYIFEKSYCIKKYKDIYIKTVIGFFHCFHHVIELIKCIYQHNVGLFDCYKIIRIYITSIHYSINCVDSALFSCRSN